MIQFSPIIVGTMRLGQWGAKFSTNEYEQFIDQCLEMGLKDFDHADIYGSYTTEEEFGAVLKKRPKLRKEMRLISKCGIKMIADARPDHKIKSYDLSAKHIELSVDQSLKNFGTDYLDLLLLHRPDYLMDPEEIASCIEGLKKSGKILHFGLSNFSASQVELISKYTEIDNHQIQISIDHLDAFDNGTLDQCIRKKIIPTAWSPVSGGLLFGHEESDKKDRIIAMAHPMSEKYNCSLDQLLLAWLLKHPAEIIPVMGTTKILRIASAIESRSIQLSHEDWYDLFQASTGQEIP